MLGVGEILLINSSHILPSSFVDFDEALWCLLAPVLCLHEYYFAVPAVDALKMDLAVFAHCFS